MRRLKDAGARHVQVVAPYLCYARKERRTQFRDPIITRYVAALFEACRVDRLTTFEVHNRLRSTMRSASPRGISRAPSCSPRTSRSCPVTSSW